MHVSDGGSRPRWRCAMRRSRRSHRSAPRVGRLIRSTGVVSWRWETGSKPRGGSVMRTEKTWNTNDIDFDEEGRFLIKNSQLAAMFRSVLGDHGEVQLQLPRIPPLPDAMCRCIAEPDRRHMDK